MNCCYTNYRYADPEVSTGILEEFCMFVRMCAGGPTNITTKCASSCGYLRRPRPGPSPLLRLFSTLGRLPLGL